MDTHIASATPVANDTSLSPAQRAERLVPALFAAAPDHDDADRFVGDNYALLKQAGLVEAGVPSELGGGGADGRELAAMLRILAHGCPATALAFSMHTHQVAVPAWRWRHQKLAAMEPLLKRVAGERIILLSSGGSDWLPGSGTAEKVEGGYRITARKGFASGAPMGDLLMTSALLTEDGANHVLHFGVNMKAPEVRVMDNWRALGMRGTGSHDIVIEGLVVPDTAVALKRKAGEWHPLFHIIATTAFPLVYAVYLGVAEAARNLALAIAKRRLATDDVVSLAGRMENALCAARLGHEHMLQAVERNAPSAETVNQVMTGKALVAENAIRTVELAMELAGGAAFQRGAGLERYFRDIQGARYHPLQAGPQARYAGAMALGMDVSRIF